MPRHITRYTIFVTLPNSLFFSFYFQLSPLIISYFNKKFEFPAEKAQSTHPWPDMCHIQHEILLSFPTGEKKLG